ncbi:hypothetical protein M153_2889000722, partial [Pseudoloma neurophilia]
MDQAKSFFTSNCKKVTNVFGSSKFGKFLQTLSPASQFFYSLVVCSFIFKYYQSNSNVHMAFAFLAGGFFLFSLANSLYEITSEKKKYEVGRRFFLNVFLCLSSMILLYFLFSYYFIPILGDFSQFYGSIKDYIVKGRTFFGKMGACFTIFSVCSSAASMIYKSVVKYLETPDFTEISIYKPINGNILERKNDEYLKVNVWVAIFIPLFSIIVNFMTINSLPGYLFPLASILQSFEITSFS